MFIRSIFFAPDEPVGGEAAAPVVETPPVGTAAPATEPQSVAESIAARRAQGVPEILHETEPNIEPTEAEVEAAALAELTAPPTGTPAAPVAAPPAGADPFAAFGGEEAVRNAHQVAEALRTETGLRTLITQGLLALNYSPEQIKAALGTPGLPGGAATQEPAVPAVPSPLVAIEDDDVVTGAQLKAIVASATADAAQQAAEAVRAEVAPVAEQFQRQALSIAQQAADATYIEILGPAPTDPDANKAWMTQAHEIQLMASANFDSNNYNPGDIRMALLAAGAEFKQRQEAVFHAYIGQKKADAAAQPMNVGGGQTPGSEPPKEPQNLAEARAQAKAAGIFG